MTVWLLGLTQVIGYGTLYYSFAILAADASQSLGWPDTWLYGALSIGLLLGGLVAPEVGRRMDRHSAGAVMSVGSVLSAASLLAAGLAPSGITFALAVVATQIAGALVLYDAAFTALVQVTGAEARRRITHLTLIAGFASTIFWPLTALLDGWLDWRAIYCAFALANVLVCVPLHALLARSRLPPVPDAEAAATAANPTPGSRKLLWLVTIGFALSGFALSAILAQMVPLLTALGLGTSALLVSALFGPAQVLVRFVNLIAGAKRHPIIATLVALAMLPAAIAILTLSAPAVAGAAIFAVILGFGSGLKSIVQGTLPLALFGSSSYGARLGVMAAVRQCLAAVAPFALSLGATAFGMHLALVAIAIVALLGVGAMAEVARSHHPRT